MSTDLHFTFLVLTLTIACATVRTSGGAPRDFSELNPLDTAALRTQWTPEQLATACADAEKVTDAKLAALAALSDRQRTFENTFVAYEQATADYADVTQRLSFMKDIHTDPKVREAAAACEERSGKYFVRLGARKDLYLPMKAVADAIKAGQVGGLDPEDLRLVELTMRDFKRNGLDLSDDKRAELVKIREELASLQTEYNHDLDENTDSVEATKEELDGLPPSFLDRLKKAPDGKYIVTCKYPDYFPVEERAKSEALRKRLETVFNQREAAKNLPLLQKAVALRDRAAHLLGYATHADFVADDRMAKSAAAIGTFLSRLQTELRGKLEADTAKMRALKVAETRDPKATIQWWDWRYYLNKLKERDYAIDDERVRDYFPADRVLSGMFQVYETLLGVKFKEVPNAAVWADGVHLYEVHDGDGRLLAKFYIDLFPRDGKYGHAACFPIGMARAMANGYQIPLSALVVNFNPPQNGKVAHLSLDEVETLFHEFGHVMHASLTTARYASQAGTNVATDFVEAPSQMLQNWVYRPEVLKLVSIDPKDPSKGLPEDLVAQIIKARHFDSGVRYSRQVWLATFDQAIHTRGEKVDVDAVEHEQRRVVMGWPVDADEHFAANFGHLMGGYDAGYYGYLWSEVFSADMFTRFEKEGVLNPATGKAYRDAILARGRTVEPMALLEQFLGRAPNEDAFLKQTGIKN